MSDTGTRPVNRRTADGAGRLPTLSRRYVVPFAVVGGVVAAVCVAALPVTPHWTVAAQTAPLSTPLPTPSGR